MKKIFLLILLSLASCGPQDAERLGYILGRGIVETISTKSVVYINGQPFYKTLDCTSQYRYVTSEFKEISPLECIYHNEANYVAFRTGELISESIFHIIQK